MLRKNFWVGVTGAALAATLVVGCSSSPESGGTSDSGSTAPTQSEAAGNSGQAPDSSAPAGDSGSSDASAPAIDGTGKTLTIWVMDGDYTPETIDAINKAFTEKTGAKADVQIQSWDGITTKITTALTTNQPPDVLDLGNTQVASFAADGGLLDLTASKDTIAAGQTWLPGLEEPATVDGKLYAIPGFAGARAAIYNKTMWAAAGVTAAPTTFAELTAALDKVKAANTASDFSAFYLPGQDWYAGMQFVWDAGGDIATDENGTWKGDMSSPEAQKGLEQFKKVQNTYSSQASQTLDTDKPDQTQIFADGKTSVIVATNGFVQKILDANPKLTEADLGTFPIPGANGTQPVMLGGSDWGIAAKSQNPELATAWVTIAASPEIQNDWVFGNDGWIPNSVEATNAATEKVSDIQKAFFQAAINSKATPAAARWADIEGTKAINDLFSSIASGTASPKDAAATFDSIVDKTLNG